MSEVRFAKHWDEKYGLMAFERSAARAFPVPQTAALAPATRTAIGASRS
jgi:hypothetical protein